MMLAMTKPGPMLRQRINSAMYIAGALLPNPDSSSKC